MKTVNRGFDKDVKMHLCCGDDSLRPVMSYISFKNGFAYATDAWVMVKNALNEISDFTEDEIKAMDGKFVHKKTYALLLKENIFSVSESGFECYTDGEKKVIPFAVLEGRFPICDSVLPSGEQVPIDRIGIDPTYLEILNKSLPGTIGVSLNFFGELNGVLVRPLSRETSKCVGIIMPKVINY